MNQALHLSNTNADDLDDMHQGMRTPNIDE